MQSQQHIVFHRDLPARKATLLYAYNTAFDEAHLPEQRQLLKSCCTGLSSSLQRTVMSVFVELFENIARYSALSASMADATIFPDQLWLIRDDAGSLHFMSGNLIMPATAPALQNRFKTLSKMGADELRDHYKERLPASEEPGRAGLGLIEIARRTHNHLTTEILPADDKQLYFILTATFENSEKEPSMSETVSHSQIAFERKSTARTPYISLSDATQEFIIEGESYPEHVTDFYNQIHAHLERYFQGGEHSLAVRIGLSYFNSGSARALLDVLMALNNYAEAGNQITLCWQCDEEDDIGREFAQDIASRAPLIPLTLADLPRDTPSE